MSLPTPTTGVGGVAFPLNLSPAEQDKIDAPLIALANQSGGDLRKLFFMFFSFLHRRTDLYVVKDEADVGGNAPARMGFKEGDAEKMMLAAFRQFPLRKIPRQGSGGGRRGPIPGNPTTALPKAPARASAEGKGQSKGRDEKNPNIARPPIKAEARAPAVTKAKDDARSAMSKVRLSEDGLQMPVGNGGCTPRYQWTQTIDEVSIVLGVPEGTRGKDINLVMNQTSLSVKMKNVLKDGEEPLTLMGGKLKGGIRKDDSTWSLEGGALLITLEKAKKIWWSTVLEGDNEIDVDYIDSTRNISSYDEATQGMIRKCLFDERAVRLGQPTSDVILGEKPKIPVLPTGVEYINHETLDKADQEKK